MSLSFIDEEGDLLELEVHESILFVNGMASEVVAQKHMPMRTVVHIQEFFQVLSHLRE